ncbi:MAG: PEP-CTERM sorting domain-containing protein [Gammaproteobacteria bacterium]|nr:PEP-CTERM sorting domain-containing protein [Gammaproteobacteria bacterium]
MKLTSTILILTASLWAGSANALLTFSDVSYTSNSLTFTVDGDMSGYAASAYNNQFSIRYNGDLWAGPTSGYHSNSWSTSIFDNKAISYAGNTGNFSNPYTWSNYSSSLSNAIASMRTVTVNFVSNFLNTNASNAIVDFYWGNGQYHSNPTYLATGTTAAVPLPGTLMLLALGAFGLVASRKLKKA